MNSFAENPFNGKEAQYRNSFSQVVNMAQYAKIALYNSEDTLDPKVELYIKMRGELNAPHGDLSDQNLFAEVLRLLGDEESRLKLIKAYPSISF